MSTFRRAQFLETGAYELGVASHAHQLTLHRQQFQSELLEVELDEVKVIRTGHDVIAATGSAAGRTTDQAEDA